MKVLVDILIGLVVLTAIMFAFGWPILLIVCINAVFGTTIPITFITYISLMGIAIILNFLFKG